MRETNLMVRFMRPLLGVALAIGLIAAPAAAQSTYQHGQSVSPAYEGWEQNEDGSFNLVFGYHNRNWSEEPIVPVGEDNFFSPGPEDRGQPTRFQPRRNRYTFKVRVPADFGDQELAWTLTTAGETETAYGSLRLDYKLDYMVIASETGALGIGVSSPEIRANTPPILTLEGPANRRARVGEPVTLVVTMEDDGLADAIESTHRSAALREQRAARATEAPTLSARQMSPPGRITVEKVVAHHVAWFVLRGEDGVTFDPPQVKTWEDTRAGANSPWAPLWRPPLVPEDGRWEVQVTFEKPGTYVLRARGDDGALYHDQTVTIVVGPIT